MGERLRVVLRDRARRDIEQAVDWYRTNVDADTASAFVDALRTALDHVSRHPGTGSPRHATELDLPGLRSWLLDRVPHMVFYVERDDHVDVWRVLHAHRDIPAWLLDPDTPPSDDTPALGWAAGRFTVPADFDERLPDEGRWYGQDG